MGLFLDTVDRIKSVKIVVMKAKSTHFHNMLGDSMQIIVRHNGSEEFQFV